MSGDVGRGACLRRIGCFCFVFAGVLIAAQAAQAQFYVRSPDVEKGELKLEEHGAIYSGPGEDERRRQSHELEVKYGFTDRLEGIAELTDRENIGDSLKWQRFELGGQYELNIRVSGEAFLTPPGDFSALIAKSVEQATGLSPELSTSGGTSDARFIKDFCPVAEFGLVGQTMHKVDERIAVADIRNLTDIYTSILTGYFANTAAKAS